MSRAFLATQAKNVMSYSHRFLSQNCVSRCLQPIWCSTTSNRTRHISESRECPSPNRSCGHPVHKHKCSQFFNPQDVLQLIDDVVENLVIFWILSNFENNFDVNCKIGDKLQSFYLMEILIVLSYFLKYACMSARLTRFMELR